MRRLLLHQDHLLRQPHEEAERAEAGEWARACCVSRSDAPTQHHRLRQGLSGLFEARGVVLPDGVEVPRAGGERAPERFNHPSESCCGGGVRCRV